MAGIAVVKEFVEKWKTLDGNEYVIRVNGTRTLMLALKALK